MTNNKTVWNCTIKGKKYKIIIKDDKWIKAKPLTDGIAYEYHICGKPLDVPGSMILHLDEDFNQKPTGKKTPIPDCKIGTAVVGDYINTSGAPVVEVFPYEPSITAINPINCSGSVYVGSNTSGPVVYVLRYSE